MTNIITLDDTQFWMRIGRMTNEALVSVAGQEFAASNFMPQHTGGGGMAWAREVGDTGWRILITNSGGTDLLLDGSAEDYWLIGAHGPNGEFSGCRETGTVGDAIVHAEHMHRLVAAGEFAALNIEGA